MAIAKWHALLLEQVPMTPAVADRLSRQLVGQARTLAQIAIDDGYHALMPPDEGFVVRNGGGMTIASIEGYLLGRDNMAHPAVLAWRSTAGADLRLTPERGADDLEFFWQEFPADELANPTRIYIGDRFESSRFRFDFDAELYMYRLPDVRLELIARTVFTPKRAAETLATIDGAIAEWNCTQPARVHDRGEADIPDDGRTIAMHIDLGSGGLDALAFVLDAVSAALVGAEVERCRVYHS
jgi:hypothetical protein